MKTMSNISLLFALIIIAFTSCSDSEDMKPDKAPDVEAEVANFEILRGGELTAQSSTNTRGMVQVVRDDAGDFFLRLTEDFTTKFSTGTVTVYLSTSSSLDLNESSSFELISVVDQTGEHFFKLSGEPDSKFTHGIIWCGAAAIPFGFTLMD